MSDSTDDHIEVEAPTWPGYPKIPPCIADQFQFEEDPTRAEISAAYWAAYEANPHPLLQGTKFIQWGWRRLVENQNGFIDDTPPSWLFAFLELDFPQFHLREHWDKFREIINADCRHWGIPELSREQFEKEWARHVLLSKATPRERRQIYAEEEQREKEAELEALTKAAYPSRPDGRPATEKTTDAQKVRDALDVSHDRAYKILRWGTGKFESRVKLAAAFADDPERNTPAAWELKKGSSWGGPRRASRTFAQYCLQATDPDDVLEYPALAVVRGLLERGELSSNPTLDELTRTVKTDANELLDLWSAFGTWRGL